MGFKIKKCGDESINFWAGPRCAYLEYLLFKDDPLNIIPYETKLEDIVVMVEFMPSKNQARKNGYSGEIKEGFGEYEFGKGKKYKNVFIHKVPKSTFSFIDRVKRRYG